MPYYSLKKKKLSFTRQKPMVPNIKPSESHNQVHVHTQRLLIKLVPPQQQVTVHYLIGSLPMKEFMSNPVLAMTLN
jgi:hypothetical protein